MNKKPRAFSRLFDKDKKRSPAQSHIGRITSVTDAVFGAELLAIMAYVWDKMIKSHSST